MTLRGWFLGPRFKGIIETYLPSSPSKLFRYVCVRKGCSQSSEYNQYLKPSSIQVSNPVAKWMVRLRGWMYI